MLRRRNRAVLFGLAAGGVLALSVRGGIAADMNLLLARVDNNANARSSPFDWDQPFSLFQQNHTLLSQSSTNSFSAGGFSLRTDTDFRDTSRTDGKSFGGAFIGDSSKWQENRVGYTNFQMNLGDTIRLKTRFGASTYDASAEFLRSLDEKKGPEYQRALRFASRRGPASGAAALTRAEQDIVTLGDVKMTLFQEFAQVNSYFEDIKFSDKAFRKETKEDVFSDPDRRTDTYGVSLVQGASGVMFSRSSISNIDGTVSGFYSEQRLKSKAWLGLRDIAKGFWKSNDPVFDMLVPSSVWFGYSEGAVQRSAGATSLTGWRTAATSFPLAMTTAAIGDAGTISDTAVQNMDAGLSWQWGGAYATFGVWRSQHVGTLSTLSFGDGGDVNLGVREQYWSASAYASLSRWNSQDVGSRSDFYALDGGASFSVLLERLPNVTLSVDVSNYAGAYTAWDGKDSGRTVSAGIALDFTKYLVERPGQTHKLFYYARNEGYDGQWGVTSSSSRTIDHVFGTVYRSSL